MRPGGSKAKGSDYERAIAKLFTAAYYPEGDGEVRRIPLSGGWDKRLVPGDLVPLKCVDKQTEEMVIDRSFPFSVECKTYADANVKHFFSGLYSKETVIFEWLEQAIDDCRPSKKMPLVVFKLFGTKNILLLESDIFYQMGNMFGNFPGKKWYKLIRNKPDEVDCTFSERIIFCLLEDFLEWIDWSVFKLSNKVRSIRSVTSEVKE